jgi:iron(III) transport system permease protein
LFHVFTILNLNHTHIVFRACFWPIILTIFVVAFLWLPALTLYGGALWHVVVSDPKRVLETLPIEPLQRALFRNTLSLCFLTAIGATIFGAIVGICAARGTNFWRNFFTIFSALPLALPPMLMASAWLEWTRTPPARSMASLAASQPSPYSPVAVSALILALCFFPVVAWPLRAALLNLAPEWEDAARLFGSPFEVAKRVLAPLLWPVLAASAGVVALLSMWEMGAPDLIDARTYSVEIYRNLNAPDELDPQGKAVKAALASVPMIALGILALWPALRVSAHWPERFASARTEYSNEKSRVAWPILLIALVILIVSPGAVIAIFGHQAQPFSVFSNVWISNRSEIGNTIIAATLAATVLIFLAVALITSWRDWPPRLQKIALLACLLPLLIAPVMTGIAAISFWNRPGLDFVLSDAPQMGWPPLDNFTGAIWRTLPLLIGYALRFGPLAILLLHEALHRAPRVLEEAAQGLGASPRHAFWTITLPQLSPAILGVFALLWALCAGELSTSVLVNQPGGQTLPVPIFNQMHIGASEEVAALSLTLFALCGGALLAGNAALNALLKRFRS